MQKILTVANYKTLKGRSFGYETFGIHFAPADISGYEVCQGRSKGCTDSCLNLAGMGVMVQPQRIEKTKSFFEQQSLFMDNLMKEIETGIKSAAKKSLQAVFRLNLTSDIRWENIIHKGKNIFQHFAGVQFYDYTKDANRKDLPVNYDLTFSYSGVSSFVPYVNKAQSKGMRMAVVFRKESSIPTIFKGIRVVSGDNSDVRHLDDQGVIVGLYAKGKAKTDTTGFVV